MEGLDNGGMVKRWELLGLSFVDDCRDVVHHAYSAREGMTLSSVH